MTNQKLIEYVEEEQETIKRRYTSITEELARKIRLNIKISAHDLAIAANRLSYLEGQQEGLKDLKTKLQQGEFRE